MIIIMPMDCLKLQFDAEIIMLIHYDIFLLIELFCISQNKDLNGEGLMLCQLSPDEDLVIG